MPQAAALVTSHHLPPLVMWPWLDTSGRFRGVPVVCLCWKEPSCIQGGGLGLMGSKRVRKVLSPTLCMWRDHRSVVCPPVRTQVTDSSGDKG